jgi:hypothetical protein
MTHFNCINPEHDGKICCDCYPKRDCYYKEIKHRKIVAPEELDKYKVETPKERKKDNV